MEVFLETKENCILRSLYSFLVFSKHWTLRTNALDIIFLLALVTLSSNFKYILFSNYKFDFKIPYRVITKYQNLSLASIYKMRRYQTQSLSANLSQLSDMLCFTTTALIYLTISTHPLRVHFYQGIWCQEEGEAFL